MKIGMLTDSLATLSFDRMLDAAAEMGIAELEFGCGNWSSAPHLDLDLLLESAPARRDFLAQLGGRGLSVCALNCSGNPLHPGPKGERHRQVTEKTLRLAGLLEVDRVVMMSGLPGGPGDANPNWIVTDWPPECAAILEHQWREAVIPYWRELVAQSRKAGVRQLCLELHGHQAVYNPRTLHRLREAVGEMVGANYDPSHPIWMGAEPLEAVRHLAGAIYHVHAKDTRIEPSAAVDGLLETRSAAEPEGRSWNYVTVGRGHDEAWWRRFCEALRLAGYDDVLSIEHEDARIDPLDGVRETVGLLRRALASGSGKEAAARP